MTSHLLRVEAALADLKQGKMIILTDHPDREDEGDLIFPAEIVSPEKINFMLQHCSGIICLSLPPSHIKALNLPFMVPPHNNTSQKGTPFTISIEAREGVTTGVSAADRAQTIKVAIQEPLNSHDIVMPGHVFPLQAREGGVLERAGHTEGAIDIVRLAGFKPAAVLCEVMNPDGTMARGKKLIEFAKEYNISICSIEDLSNYRLTKESVIQDTATAVLPLDSYGEFTMNVIKEKFTQKEHVVLIKETRKQTQSTLVRIHSMCMTGDVFNSQRCDCHQQLHYSLNRIKQEGGILIYLSQEGRGIGLFDKIKSYALQEQGMDTVDANHHLGWSADMRQYYVAAHILKQLGENHIRLLTNNPHKISDLKKYGIANVEREEIPVFSNQHNINYLLTKQNKLHHLINCAGHC